MGFANPASEAKANAARYIAELLAVLGDRDPWEVLGELVPWLKRKLAGVSDAELRRPEAPGKWSVLQVAQHLADSELVYGYRIRMIVAHDEPEIQGYDQDLWVTRLSYNSMALADTMAELELLRRLNHRLIRSLSEAHLDRVGQHSERGPESVRKILSMLAAHDLVHRRQIERLLHLPSRS